MQAPTTARCSVVGRERAHARSWRGFRKSWDCGDWAPDYRNSFGDTHMYGAASQNKNEDKKVVLAPVEHAKAYAQPKYSIAVPLSKSPASEDGGEIADYTSDKPVRRSTTCYALDKLGTGSKDQYKMCAHEEDREFDTSYSHYDMQPPTAPKASKGAESTRALKPVNPQQDKLKGLGPCSGAVEEPHLISEARLTSGSSECLPGPERSAVFSKLPTFLGDHFSAAALECANKLQSKIKHPGAWKMPL
eukprot:gene9223-16367_t